MKCGHCRYGYRYHGREYEVESCPNCGHRAPFREFVEEEQGNVLVD